MNEILMGIDIGYRNAKGANTIIPSGIYNYNIRPPISMGTIEYADRYYSVGHELSTVPESKFRNEDTLIATMAIIAEELNLRGLRSGNVRLGVGLPLTSYSSQKQDYINYMLKERRLKYKYSGGCYNVFLLSVDVFPQGYAAVADRLGSFGVSAVVLDIGGWSLDIMPLVDGSPDLSRSMSIPMGVTTAYQSVQEVIRQEFREEVEEVFFREIMLNRTCNLDDRHQEVIRGGFRKYAIKIIDTLRSLNFNPTTRIVVIGGGASLMKNFADTSIYSLTCIEDININAKGYEALLRAKYRGKVQ